jgi:hypothetical protein
VYTNKCILNSVNEDPVVKQWPIHRGNRRLTCYLKEAINEICFRFHFCFSRAMNQKLAQTKVKPLYIFNKSDKNLRQSKFVLLLID